MQYLLTIYGKPATKKNSSRILSLGAKCPVCHKGQKQIVMPSEQYKKYEALALPQLREQWKDKAPINERVNVCEKFYLADHRLGDVNNYSQAVDDILVLAGVLEDDNYTIVQTHDGTGVYGIDKNNPRVEIIITEVAPLC